MLPAKTKDASYKPTTKFTRQFKTLHINSLTVYLKLIVIGQQNKALSLNPGHSMKFVQVQRYMMSHYKSSVPSLIIQCALGVQCKLTIEQKYQIVHKFLIFKQISDTFYFKWLCFLNGTVTNLLLQYFQNPLRELQNDTLVEAHI